MAVGAEIVTVGDSNIEIVFKAASAPQVFDTKYVIVAVPA